MLPKPLIEEFWDRVRSFVKKKGRMDDESARSAIDRFKAQVEPNVGEMIFHEDAEKVATTIANGMKGGAYVGSERKGA